MPQAEERDRGSYIGASMVPSILGLNPYQTRWDVWARLTGRSKGPRKNEHMYRGIYLEDDVQDYLTKTKAQILEVRPKDFFVHDEFDFFGSHNDGYTVWDPAEAPEDDLIHSLEIKCPSSHRWRIIREQGLPTADVIQAQAGAAIRKLHTTDVVLHNADDWTTLLFAIEVREELWGYIQEQVELFWTNHIIPDEPPEPFPTPLPPDIETIAGEALDVGEDEGWTELMEQYARYRAAKDRIKVIYEGDEEEGVQGLKAKVIEKMGAYEEVVGVAGKAIHRPNSTRSRFSKKNVQGVGPYWPKVTRQILEDELGDEQATAILERLRNEARIDVEDPVFYEEYRSPYFRIFPSDEVSL